MSDIVDEFIRETNRLRAGEEEEPAEDPAEPEDESAADALEAFLEDQEDR